MLSRMVLTTNHTPRTLLNCTTITIIPPYLNNIGSTNAYRTCLAFTSEYTLKHVGACFFLIFHANNNGGLILILFLVSYSNVFWIRGNVKPKYPENGYHCKRGKYCSYARMRRMKARLDDFKISFTRYKTAKQMLISKNYLMTNGNFARRWIWARGLPLSRRVFSTELPRTQWSALAGKVSGRGFKFACGQRFHSSSSNRYHPYVSQARLSFNIYVNCNFKKSSVNKSMTNKIIPDVKGGGGRQGGCKCDIQ